MKKTIIIFLILFSTLSYGEVIVINVKGMVCQLCVHGIKKKMKKKLKERLQEISIDLEKKTVTLKTNEAKKKIPDSLLKKIIRDSGYNVQKITRKEASK